MVLDGLIRDGEPPRDYWTVEREGRARGMLLGFVSRVTNPYRCVRRKVIYCAMHARPGQHKGCIPASELEDEGLSVPLTKRKPPGTRRW